MPYKITLEDIPAGYAGTYAKAGELVQIIFRDFISTEDGQHFIKRLESGVNPILEELPTPVPASTIDHLLAITFKGGETTVYVNELDIQVSTKVARPVKAGQVVTRDDIADLVHVDLGVDIPEDAGFIFVFSVGWRKGLLFDYGPILPNQEPRLCDIGSVLAQSYAHVLFQELFSITESEWEYLSQGKWFPFTGLRKDTIDRLISYARAGWDLDEKLDDIVTEVKSRAPDMLNSWQKSPVFSTHIEILERAVERYLSDDPMSCTGLLFPRIEGIMRSNHADMGSTEQPSEGNLSTSAVSANIRTEKCLLLPHRFEKYLREVYFANFDPRAPHIEASRHSVSHGVASTAEFSLKNATISILIVHQLFYFLRTERDQSTAQEKPAELNEQTS